MRTMSRRGRVWIRQMTIGDSESRGYISCNLVRPLLRVVRRKDRESS